MTSQQLRVIVHNESQYWRLSPVEMSWAKISAKWQSQFGESLEQCQVLDSNGKPTLHQIDRVDINDPTKDMLVFLADVQERSTAMYSISRIDSDETEEIEQKATIRFLQPEEKWDAELSNSEIKMLFHRGRTPSGHMAGSAYSLETSTGINLTNPYNLPVLGKRLMQLEKIFIKTPWDPYSEAEWYFADCDYEYVNSSEGPLRCFLTVKAPFYMIYDNPVRSGPGKIITRLNCFLYRVISLYSCRDYVCEDIYAEAKGFRKSIVVNGTELLLDEGINSLDLSFVARFHMVVPGLRGYDRDFKMIYVCPDWFSVGNNSFPHPGIGFASNVHVTQPKDLGDLHWNWDLYPTWHIRCLHQFMYGKNTPEKEGIYDFGDVVGKRWYDVIYTPLWGEMMK